MTQPPTISTLKLTGRVGVYPGTFDPITIGHMDIIKRAASLVDHLIVAVAADIPKTPIFSLEQRASFVKADIEQFGKFGNTIFHVSAFQGLLVKFAKENGANVIFRGLRAVSDYEYEFQMACMNAKLEPTIETVFLPADETVQFISSRFVKEIARLNGDISDFVSPAVAQELRLFYSAH